MELTQEQLDALKSKGLSEERIQQLAKQKGYTLPKPKTLSGGQINELKARGLDDAKIQTLAREKGYAIPETGAVQGFVQSALSAPLRIAATGADILARTRDIGKSLIQKFDGRDAEAQKTLDESQKERERIARQGYDLGYLGQVKPLTSIGSAIGAGAETGSFLIGGGGGAQVVKSGLKGLIGQGLKEGVKTGLASGATMGLGVGLQEAEGQKPAEAFKTVFENTAISGIIGGLTGGILGGTTPVVAKGISGVKKFANVGELENKLAGGFKRILNPTAKQVKADTRFGNDSFKFLSQEFPDLPLTVNKDGRVVADDAIEMLKQKYTAESTAYKPIIRNSGKYVDIDNVIAQAKKAAKNEFDGTDLTKAEQQIDNEVNAYLANSPQDVNVTANGKRFVDIARADDIKSYSWSRGKGWGTPEAEVWNDTNNLIGHALKDAIEKELPDAPIKAMNRRLGQLKNAIDMLERRNGMVSGSGGKLAKYLIRGVSTTIGAGAGSDSGIGGTISGAGAGFMTAEILATIMASPKVRLYIVRKLLNNLKKSGRTDMIKEAERILSEQSSKYLLPSVGQSSYVPPVAPTINLPESVTKATLGSDTVKNAVVNTTKVNKTGDVFVKDLKTGKTTYKPRQNSNIAQPIKAPKTVAKKVSIPKSTTKPYPQSSEIPKTVRVWVKSKFSDKGAYAELPVIRKVENITLYQGGSVGDTRQFWTPDKKYASQFGEVKEKTGDFYRVNNGNTMTDVYVEVPKSVASQSSLLTEAKKYKSAEEFVKAQGTPVYRGGGELDGAKISEKGVSFSTDKKIAGSFSNDSKTFQGAVIDKNAKILQWNDIPKEITANKNWNASQKEMSIIKYAKEKGFDGVDMSKLYNEKEVRIFNTDAIKTKSQLTDIWKKANGK